MISVTLVLTILNVILQQRETLLKQRWEVMRRMFVKVQRDNRLDEDYDDDEVINPSIYDNMKRYLGEILY